MKGFLKEAFYRNLETQVSRNKHGSAENNWDVLDGNCDFLIGASNCPCN